MRVKSGIYSDSYFLFCQRGKWCVAAPFFETEASYSPLEGNVASLFFFFAPNPIYPILLLSSLTDTGRP